MIMLSYSNVCKVIFVATRYVFLVDMNATDDSDVDLTAASQAPEHSTQLSSITQHVKS